MNKSALAACGVGVLLVAAMAAVAQRGRPMAPGNSPPASARPTPKVELAFVAKVLSVEAGQRDRCRIEVTRTLTGSSREGEVTIAYPEKGQIEQGKQYILYCISDNLSTSVISCYWRKPELATEQRVKEVAQEFADSPPTAGPPASMVVSPSSSIRLESDGYFNYYDRGTRFTGEMAAARLLPVIEKAEKLPDGTQPPDGKPAEFVKTRRLGSDGKPIFAMKWVDKKTAGEFSAELLAIVKSAGKPTGSLQPDQKKMLLESDEVIHCQSLVNSAGQMSAKVKIIETLKGPDRAGETSMIFFDGGAPVWKEGEVYVVCLVPGNQIHPTVAPLSGILAGAANVAAANALFRQQGLSGKSMAWLHAKCISSDNAVMLDFTAMKDGTFKFASRCEYISPVERRRMPGVVSRDGCQGHQGAGKLSPAVMRQIAQSLAKAEGTSQERAGSAYFLWHDATGRKQSKRFWNVAEAPCPALIDRIVVAALCGIEVSSPPPPAVDAAAVNALVAELGSSKWDTRRAAADKLKAMGAGVCPVLQAAKKPGIDPQLATGIAEVLQDFQDQRGDRFANYFEYIATLSLDGKSMECKANVQQAWKVSFGGQSAKSLFGHCHYVAVLPMGWVYRIADGKLVAKREAPVPTGEARDASQ